MLNTTETRFPRGARVRMVRQWNAALAQRDGVANITIEGTVESWKEIDGGGYLHLAGVAHEHRGGWAAPSSDANQTTTLELIEL